MKVYDFINLQQIKDACQLTTEHKFLTLVLGGPGLGKTFSMNYLRRRNENTFFISIAAKDNRAYVDPWRRLALQVVGEETYYSKCVDLSYGDLIEYLVFGLNSRGTDNLVLVDEAGAMSFPMLRNFRNLVDLTRSSTGYLISGPEYFRDNINIWD